MQLLRKLLRKFCVNNCVLLPRKDKQKTLINPYYCHKTAAGCKDKISLGTAQAWHNRCENRSGNYLTDLEEVLRAGG